MNNVLLTLIMTVEMHHTLFIHADEFGRWRSWEQDRKGSTYHT